MIARQKHEKFISELTKRPVGLNPSEKAVKVTKRKNSIRGRNGHSKMSSHNSDTLTKFNFDLAQVDNETIETAKGSKIKSDD